jgi:hypothetical protein
MHVRLAECRACHAGAAAETAGVPSASGLPRRIAQIEKVVFTECSWDAFLPTDKSTSCGLMSSAAPERIASVKTRLRVTLVNKGRFLALFGWEFQTYLPTSF